MRNKYGNKKVCFDGYTFASVKEYRRYNDLQLMKRAGVISDLVVHPPFVIIDAFMHHNKRIRGARYTADFQYWDNEKQLVVVEDVKSPPTRKEPAYGLRTKLFRQRYPDMMFVEVL